ncbi:hypothetical protein HDK90DRAFT_487477, partial [Phyllosticta capitalensis]
MHSRKTAPSCPPRRPPPPQPHESWGSSPVSLTTRMKMKMRRRRRERRTRRRKRERRTRRWREWRGAVSASSAARKSARRTERLWRALNATSVHILRGPGSSAARLSCSGWVAPGRTRRAVMRTRRRKVTPVLLRAVLVCRASWRPATATAAAATTTTVLVGRSAARRRPFLASPTAALRRPRSRRRPVCCRRRLSWTAQARRRVARRVRKRPNVVMEEMRRWSQPGSRGGALAHERRGLLEERGGLWGMDYSGGEKLGELRRTQPA